MMLMRLVLVVLLSVLVMSAERLCPPGKIWKPLPGTTWEWQIGASNANHSANVQMYDIDLFDSTEATINSLHAENKIVICYFSAGTWVWIYLIKLIDRKTGDLMPHNFLLQFWETPTDGQERDG